MRMRDPQPIKRDGTWFLKGEKFSSLTAAYRHIKRSNPEIRKPPVHQGESSPNAKLSYAKVSAIRLHLKNGMKIADIAKQFGVSRATVYTIEAHRSWRSLPDQGQ